MNKVSPELLASVVPEGWFDLSFTWRLNLDWSGLVSGVNAKIAKDGFDLFTIFFMMTLLKGVLVSMAGPAPNFDMQKVLSARTPKEAALMSWCVSFVLNIPRYLMIASVGILGLAFFSDKLNTMAAAGEKVDFEQILPYVIQNYLTPGVVGMILAGLIAAFMSTFDATVNCGASYLVNDVYKRYIKRDGSHRNYVIASYICSILVVAVGMIFGLMTDSVQTVTQWVVTGLFGGYMAPNVLKWHWWRFNGFGYFAGMISGLLTATAGAVYFAMAGVDSVPMFGGTLEKNLAVFPIVFAVGTFFSIFVSLATKPENEGVLKDFYRNVRPWGFWGPIRDKVMAEDPSFRPNKAFARDMVNVAVGIIWQVTFVLMPIYLVIRRFSALAVAAVIAAITSIFLKFNWYDKLEEY
jgi:Na+/proline symporter